MLHLKRNTGQAIIINNEIEILVSEVIGKKTVKLSIKYPSGKNYTVLRKEVHEAITLENKRAMDSEDL